MNPAGQRTPTWSPVRATARLRLALSYALFLLVAGAVMSVCIYLVMRYVPNYPLTAANPRDEGLAIASRQDILDTVVRACGISLAVLAVVGIIGGWWLAGRVLRPLADLNAAARAAAEGDLSRRVGAAVRRRDEFTDLAETFDDMLDRLERDLQVQRRFAANASHELRTPLAVTQAMLDVARAAPDEIDVPVLLDRLDETNRRATGLVVALLQLSALDGGPIAREAVPLDVVVEDAIDDLRVEAAERGVTVRPDLSPAVVDCDAELLLRVVDNLLRNAVRYNLPSAGWVDVLLRTEALPGGPGERATLVVESSGPVVDAERLAVAMEPFTRDPARPRTREPRITGTTPDSHGLGLPLASRIVRAHDGTMRLTPRDGGGVTASVVLACLARRQA